MSAFTGDVRQMTKLDRYEAPEDDAYNSPLGHPLRVVARLRNNRLIRAREQAGFATCLAAARVLGMPQSSLSGYETLRISPLRADGEWKDSALRVAAFYKQSPSVLWPDAVLGVGADEREVVLEIERPELFLAQSTPEDALERREMLDVLRRAVAMLDARDQEAIHQFMHSGDPVGGRALGDVLGVTRARGNQIVARALRRVRNNVRIISAPVVVPRTTCPACAAVVPSRDAHRPRPGLVEREEYGAKVWSQGTTCNRLERLRIQKQGPVKALS